MMRTDGRPVYLIGSGISLPPYEYTSEEVGAYFNVSPEKVGKIKTLLGIESRRLSWNLYTGEQAVSNDEMAGEAANCALVSAGVTPEEVDCIVTGSSVPDYLMPNISSRVMKHIGVEEAVALSLYGGCANFVEALAIATNFIQAGMVSTAVVTGSEVCSTHAPALRTALDALLFADAGGAIVLSSLPRDDSDFVFEIKDFYLGTRAKIQGEPAEVIVMTAGGYRVPPKVTMPNTFVEPKIAQWQADWAGEIPAEYRVQHNGQQALFGAIPAMVEGFERVTKSDPPLPGAVVPHQGSGAVIAALDSQIPDGWTLIDNVAHRGNISSACVPVAFHERFDEVRNAESVVFTTVGNGLSFGAALLAPVR